MRRFKDNKFFGSFPVVDCVRIVGELATKPNLSYETGEMYNMWKQGVPINNEHSVSMYSDGDVNPSWQLPVDRLRGVDVADVWQSQQSARSKVKRAATESK